jgi:hypothetical protein
MGIKDKLKTSASTNYQNSSSGGFDNYFDFEKSGLEKLKIEKDKDYLVDILTYSVETDKHPNGKKKGDVDYTLSIFVHNYFKIGSYLCMDKTFGKPCPLCEEFERLKQKLEHDGLTREEIWAQTKIHYPQQRNIYYFLVDGKRYVADIAYKGFEALWWKSVEMKAKRGINIAPFYLNEEGCTSLMFSTKSKGENFFDYISFDFPEIENYNAKYTKDLISMEKLLIIPDQEKLEKIINGDIDEEDNDEPEEKPKSKKQDYVKDVLEKEQEEQDDEDETPEPPKKKKSEVKSDVNSCPNKVKFGVDFDSYEVCDSCQNDTPDNWKACKLKYEEIG